MRVTAFRLFLSICALVVVISEPLQAAENKKFALLIGNSDYTHVPRLANPVNDANALGAAFDRIGFEVSVALNLDGVGLNRALRDFARKARNADVAILYFAGHGLEIDGTNYLLPVNAKLSHADDAEYEAIRLEKFLRAIGNAQTLKLLLVDACRDNPFLDGIGDATRSLGRGLARVEPPGGVVVGYAARGGTVAFDGEGRNSPYASALLEHMEEPGLEIGRLFRRVRDSVFQSTEGRQEPFVYGSLPAADIFIAGESTIRTDFDAADTLATVEAWDNFLRLYEFRTDSALVSAAKRLREAAQERDVAAAERQRLADEAVAAKSELLRLADEAERVRAESEELAKQAAKAKETNERLALLAAQAEAERERLALEAAEAQAERDRISAEAAKAIAAERERIATQISDAVAAEQRRLEDQARLSESTNTAEQRTTAALSKELLDRSFSAISSPPEAERLLSLSTSQRRNVQILLRELGYDPGPADGVIGKKTREAISRFQLAHGVDDSGYLNDATIQRISDVLEAAPRSRDGKWRLTLNRKKIGKGNLVAVIGFVDFEISGRTVTIIDERNLSMASRRQELGTRATLSKAGMLQMSVTVHTAPHRNSTRRVSVASSLPERVEVGQVFELATRDLNSGFILYPKLRRVSSNE